MNTRESNHFAFSKSTSEDARMALQNLLSTFSNTAKDAILAAIINNPNAGICITDKDGFIVAINEAFSTLSGYSKAELTGSYFTKFLPAATQKEQQLLYHKNGYKVPVFILDELLEKQAHNSYNITILTETKINGESINTHIANEKFRDIIGNAMHAFFIQSSTGAILENNDATLELFGYSAIELPQVNINELFDINSQEWQDIINTRANTGKAKGEVKAIKKNGEVFSCEIFTVAFTDKGNQQCIGNVVMDLSLIKKQAIELQQINHEMEIILDNTEEVFFVINTQLEILTFNKAAKIKTARFLNINLNKGLSFLALVPSKKQKLFANAFANLQMGKTIHTKHTFLYASEMACIYDIVFTPISDEYGNNNKFIVNARDITAEEIANREIKKSRHMIKLNERRYRALVENGADAVVILTEDAKPLYVSPSAYKILGYKEEDADHLDMFSLTHSEDIPYVIDVWQKVLENPGIPIRGYTSRILHKNGTWRWMEDTITNLLHDPSVNGIVDNFRDVTDKIEADEKLIKSFKEISDYKFALDESCIVDISDQHGTILQVNDNFVKISKYSAAEVVGKNHNIVNSGYHDKAFFENLWQTVNAGKVWRGEIRNKAKDGSLYWVDATIVPFLNEDGKPYQYLAITNDISHRKEAENALEISNERFELASKATSDAIWDWDLVSHTKHWGQGFTTLFGHTIEDHAYPYSWKEHIHPDDREEVVQSIYDAINGNGNIWNKEYRYLKYDGTYAFVHDKGLIVRNSQQKGIRMIGAINDISERKLAEQQLKELNLALSLKADELSTSNADLQAFAYIASHDLQEPLRMVTSFLDLLERKYGNKIDETSKQYIHFAVDGAERMKVLIKDLLAYSRVGTRALEIEKVNVSEVVEEIKQTLFNDFDDNKATLITENLPTYIMAGKTAFTQLLQNLVGNALKYQPPGNTPIITITAEQQPNHWLFCVKDNGIGLDPKFYDKIFVVFQRLHNRDDYSGTGIGLAICKKIVERYNGKIWVTSTPGKGSSFYFSLPIK